MLSAKNDHDYSITKIDKKRKRQVIDSLETLMMSGQQSFEHNYEINLIQIRIDDDWVVSTLIKNLQTHIINLFQ